MSVVNLTPSQAHDENRWVFDFLRKRATFVATFDGFEALVLWGPVVDAVATLHDRRLARSTEFNSECFHSGLVDLVHFIDLTTISVPLLHQALRALKATNTEASQIFGNLFPHSETGAAPYGQLWSTRKDIEWRQHVSQATSGVTSKAVRRAIRDASYAGILYTEYRCPLVHGLDLGWRAWTGSDALGPGSRDDEPSYMNFLYGDDDPRPNEHRGRVRISFSQQFLARTLNEMIDNEERECAAAGWSVGRFPTRDI